MKKLVNQTVFVCKFLPFETNYSPNKSLSKMQGYGQKGAADLQRPWNGTDVHTHSGIGCSLSSSGCVHSSSWAVICAIFAGHSRRIASHRVPQRLHYKRIRSESLLDLINVISLFHVSVLVSPVDITVEDQFYIWLRLILCFRYVEHGIKLKMKKKNCLTSFPF